MLLTGSQLVTVPGAAMQGGNQHRTQEAGEITGYSASGKVAKRTVDFQKSKPAVLDVTQIDSE